MGAGESTQLATHLLCPRCGYELTGQVDAFQARDDEGASCPLRGTCAECGLEVEWRTVVRPEQGLVAGFYEHAPRLHRASPGSVRRRASWAAFWRTWWWALAIAALWGRATVDTPVHPWRSVRWAAIALTLCVLLPGLVGAAGRTTHALTVPWVAGGYIIQPNAGWLAAHLAEGALTAGTGGAVSVELAGARLVLAPRGGYVLVGTFHPRAWMNEVRPRSFGGRVAALALPIVLAPLTLLLLSSTRALAKIRLAHVARAAALSVAVLAVPQALLLGALAVSSALAVGLQNWEQQTRRALQFADGALTVIVPAALLWLCVYWALALRSYRWPAGERWKATGAVLAVLVVASLVLVLPRMVYWQQMRDPW